MLLGIDVGGTFTDFVLLDDAGRVRNHNQLTTARDPSQAIQHGKHVFVEKPFAASSEQAVRLIEEADRRNLTLMVGHTFQYSPPVMKIKEILEAGELGEIFYISSTRVNLGLHQKDVSVIWDLAPHDLSMIFYWLDEAPIEVLAAGRDFVQKGIPDVAFMFMRFASGAIAHVQVSWLAPSKLRRTTIVGQQGTFLLVQAACQ